MHGERMPSSSNEPINEFNVTVANGSETVSEGANELPRETAEKMGKAAIRAAFADAMPPIQTPKANPDIEFSSDKKQKLNSLLRDQAELIAETTGRNPNSVRLDQAELYTNGELVAARAANSFSDVLTALSAGGQNAQLAGALQASYNNLQSTNVLGSLEYDRTTKQIVNPSEQSQPSLSFDAVVSVDRPPADSPKKERLNSILRDQAKQIAETTGQDYNSVVLEQSERAGDLYTNQELVAARLIKSFDDVLATLSAVGDSGQLLEATKAAFENMKAPGAIAGLVYDHNNKQLALSAAERPSSPAGKIIDFDSYSQTDQSQTLESAA